MMNSGLHGARLTKSIVHSLRHLIMKELVHCSLLIICSRYIEQDRIWARSGGLSRKTCNTYSNLYSKTLIIKVCIKTFITKTLYIGKKTIIFELEGVLMNLRDNDLESTVYDCKLQVKSQENNIISQKEYFIKFRPYLVEMLRALRPFFELVVYTSKTK
jgi:hypothetical protein